MSAFTYLIHTVHLFVLCPLKIQAGNQFVSSSMMLYPEAERKYPRIQTTGQLCAGKRLPGRERI